MLSLSQSIILKFHGEIFVRFIISDCLSKGNLKCLVFEDASLTLQEFGITFILEMLRKLMAVNCGKLKRTFFPKNTFFRFFLKWHRFSVILKLHIYDIQDIIGHAQKTPVFSSVDIYW